MDVGSAENQPLVAGISLLFSNERSRLLQDYRERMAGWAAHVREIAVMERNREQHPSPLPTHTHNGSTRCPGLVTVKASC